MLIEHLKTQSVATVIYDFWARFHPAGDTATYNSTKAGIHSSALSQRYLLHDTPVSALEIAPLYVQMELNGPEHAANPRAMPFDEFIEETVRVLGT